MLPAEEPGPDQTREHLIETIRISSQYSTSKPKQTVRKLHKKLNDFSFYFDGKDC